MPIQTKDVHFGEGVSPAGTSDAKYALQQHRKHIRVQRLNDLLGKEATLDNGRIADKFEDILAAIEAADDQVNKDNAAFIRKHKLSEE